MRRMGHVTRMGMKRNAYRIFVGESEGKNHLQELNRDGRIILKWILKKEFGK